MSSYTRNQSPVPGIPAPTRARTLFPTLEAVHAAGISGITLEESRIVAAVLSRFIASGTSKTRGKVGIMLGLLVPACRVELVRDGELHAAALPDLPTGPLASGATPFNQLGIDHLVMTEYWTITARRADDACMPLAWLLAFVPAPFWEAVATLIRWGPYEAGVRAEEAVIVLARTPIRQGNRRRPEGSSISKGTLENRVDYLWSFMDAIIDLQATVRASANPSLSLVLLESWVKRPTRVDVEACGAREARIDTAGPPIEECSRNLHRLYAEWQNALPNRRYRKLRKLLLQALLPLLGPRLDALRMLDVDDYLPNHLGADGIRSPILRIYPGKTRDLDEAYLLPLPEELAEWIEAWIVLTGRAIGQEGTPLWPSRQPKPGKPIKRISEGGLRTSIAGRKGSNGRPDQVALLPRGEDPCFGFNPHAFRHTAYQAAKRAGKRVIDANRTEFGHDDPEDFARAVCGHSLMQSLRDHYLDHHQLRLARAAIAYAWDELWRGGKRHGLDPRAILQHKNEVTVLTATADDLRARLASLHRQQETLAASSATLSGDALNTALIESNRNASETQMVLLDLNRVLEQQQAAEGRLAESLTTEVALSDDLTDEEHARMLSVALATEHEFEAEDEMLADELHVVDLAELFGTRAQTINAWKRTGFPRGRPAPWDPASWVVHGPRNKRLPVSALDLSLLTATQRQRLSEIRRRRAILDNPDRRSLLSA